MLGMLSGLMGASGGGTSMPDMSSSAKSGSDGNSSQYSGSKVFNFGAGGNSRQQGGVLLLAAVVVVVALALKKGR